MNEPPPPCGEGAGGGGAADISQPSKGAKAVNLALTPPSPCPLPRKGGEAGASTTSASFASIVSKSYATTLTQGGAIYTSERAEAAAKWLRSNPTFAEKQLWAELRNFRAQGFPFRRQAPIGPYIVDFVCHSARLIIELDGGIHILTAERDAAREAWLVAQRYSVLRLDNAAVIQRLDDAMLIIRNHLQKR